MTAPADRPAKRIRRDVHGIVLLDKPKGLSSNQALQRVKYLLAARKAGHTGSLDPLATGMLPLCFGDATRFSHALLDADKCYDVVMQLGAQSATGDGEGEIVARADVPAIGIDGWREIAERFVGRIDQIPPMYSALKHNGKRLYEIARAGGEVDRRQRQVIIRSLTVNSYENEQLALSVRCSKGTYIRTLVEDLAAAVGTLAWTHTLRRTSVLPFDQPMFTLAEIERALEIDAAMPEILLSSDVAVGALPAVTFDRVTALRFCNGQRLAAETVAVGRVRCYEQAGVFLGTAIVDEQSVLRPDRVMSAAQALFGRDSGHKNSE